MEAIRADRRFSESMIVTLIEKQGSKPHAGHLAGYFNRPSADRRPLVHHLRVMEKDGALPIGVPTQLVHKKRYVRALNMRLAQRSIAIADNLVLAGNDATDPQKSRNELFKQLRAFSQKVEKDPNLFMCREPKVSYDGKDDGPDDRAMCLQILNYWSWRAVEYDRSVQTLTSQYFHLVN